MGKSREPQISRMWAEEAKSEADRETLLEMAKVWTLLTLQKDLAAARLQAGPAINKQP
jgi:hypothetical protein